MVSLFEEDNCPLTHAETDQWLRERYSRVSERVFSDSGSPYGSSGIYDLGSRIKSEAEKRYDRAKAFWQAYDAKGK
jgi:hypothetical protein